VAWGKLWVLVEAAAHHTLLLKRLQLHVVLRTLHRVRLLAKLYRTTTHNSRRPHTHLSHCTTMSAVAVIAVTTAGRSLRGIKRPLGTLLLRRGVGSSTTITKAEDLQHGVSRTSIGTTIMRAMEQNQAQPLFQDPYAAMLARGHHV